MKKLIKLAGVIAALALLNGCSGLIDDVTEGDAQSPKSTVTKQKGVALNEDGTITFALKATDALGELSANASRTIAPNADSELYFTVFGATEQDSTSGDAVYTTTTGDKSKTVYYPTEANKVSGIPFTIAVTTDPWYFTAYGTYKSPEDISPSTNDDATRLAAIKAAATVKGTLKFYVKIDDSTGEAYFYEDSSYTTQSDMTIKTKVSSEKDGTAIIPVSLPDQSDLKTDSVITKATLKILEKGTTTQKATITVDSLTAAGSTFAFAPAIASGNYDVAITFFNSDDKEVYFIDDVLTVWPDYESIVEGSSGTIVKDVAYTSTYEETGTAKTTSGSKKGYEVTTDLIKAYRRQTFYVGGTGASDTDGTGSLFAPFATVKQAVAAIGSRLADGTEDGSSYKDKSTEWRIIINGAISDTTAVTITNASTTEDAIISIEKYAGATSASVAAPLTVTATKGAKSLKFTAEDVTLSGNIIIGTPNFFLEKAKLTGEVTLNKEDATKNGVINVDPADTDSEAKKIKLVGSYGSLVVKSTATAFENSDSADWRNQYVLMDSYINELDTNTSDTTEIKRVLEVGTDAANTDQKGNLIVKIQQNTIGIENGASNKYTSTISLSNTPLTTENVNTTELSFEIIILAKETAVTTLTPTVTVKDSSETLIPATNYTTDPSSGSLALSADTSSATTEYPKATKGTLKLKLSSDTFKYAASDETYKIQLSYTAGQDADTGTDYNFSAEFDVTVSKAAN